MKKIIIRCLATAILVTMAAFIIFGIYIKNQLKQTGETGLFLETESLVGKLPYIARPDTAGKGVFANSMYMLNSSFSDSVVTSESDWGDISLETRHVIMDKNGSIIRYGALAVAETQKCFMDEYKSCTDYNTSYGLVNITSAFNDMQLQTLSGEMLQGAVSLRIDSYHMNGAECFPVSITVLRADEPIYIFECSVPSEAEQTELIDDAPLWIHAPVKTDWRDMGSVREESELVQWCYDNPKVIFTSDNIKPEGSISQNIHYTKTDMTSLLGGSSIITAYSDGNYALVFLQKINCSELFITVILRSICIGGGIAVLVLIISLLRRRKK